MTGTLNRRSLDRIGSKEALRSEEMGSPVSVIMLDIDHFKLVNDATATPPETPSCSGSRRKSG